MTWAELIYLLRTCTDTEIINEKREEIAFWIPEAELAKYSPVPVLTTRTFLAMCRVAYDASSRWEKYKDLSNEALFCKARMFSLQHEYDMGILGGDWDSPKKFYSNSWFSYHFE